MSLHAVVNRACYSSRQANPRGRGIRMGNQQCAAVVDLLPSMGIQTTYVCAYLDCYTRSHPASHSSTVQHIQFAAIGLSQDRAPNLEKCVGTCTWLLTQNTHVYSRATQDLGRFLNPIQPLAFPIHNMPRNYAGIGGAERRDCKEGTDSDATLKNGGRLSHVLGTARPIAVPPILKRAACDRMGVTCQQ
jgi:hypothetical protein